jgi:hypothetical protein
MERARLAITSSTSRKSRKLKPTDNSSTDAATLKHRKSRSPSRGLTKGKHNPNSVRFDPFVSNRSSKSLSEARQSAASGSGSIIVVVSSDDEGPSVDHGKRVKAIVPTSSRLSENSARPSDAEPSRHARKEGADKVPGKHAERLNATMSALTAECERLRKENEALKQSVQEGKKSMKKREKVSIAVILRRVRHTLIYLFRISRNSRIR